MQVKSLFLIVLFVFAAGYTTAQKASVYFSDDLHENSDGNFLTSTGESEKYLYCWFKDNNTIKLIGLDKENHYSKTTLFEHKSGGFLRFHSAIMYRQNQLLLYSEQTKTTQKIYLSLINDQGQLLRSMLLQNIELPDRRSSADVFFSISPAGNFLTFAVKNARNSDSSDILLIQYDENINLLWEHYWKYDENPSNFHLIALQTNNDGNVFLLGQSNTKEQSRMFSLPYTLVAYDHVNKKMNEWMIQLDEENIFEIQMLIDGMSNVYIAGTYTKNNKSRIRGIFALRLDYPDYALKYSVKYDWDPSQLIRWFGESKTKDPGIEDLHIIYALPGKQKELFFFVEQQKEYEQCYTDFRTGLLYCNRHYMFGTILSTAIDSNGTIIYQTPFVKRQETMNDGGIYSSFALIPYKDSFFLLYNDHEKNIDRLSNPKAMNALRTMAPYLYKLDAEGSKKIYRMFKPGKGSYYWMPYTAVNIAPGKIVFKAIKYGNRFKIGVLEID
ncbi:MAG: hypothetical protein KatS3mg034_1367 [Vicingaceae bacterium]|nr:MAG: hypothetical protein KatS3mg034_1367 [Vicingaceae bacterium]